MRTHSNGFDNNIKKFGREIDSKLTYNGNIIDTENLYNITPILHTELLKSVMKEINIESKTNIPVGSEINYQFGVKVRDNTVLDYRDNYDYVNYGNYIVKDSEYNEANENYTIKAYDKMLYAMKEYTTLQSAEFPMTVREYITALCSDLSTDDFTLVFANTNDTFVNYNKIIPTDVYANINYTYRDIFDDLSEVTASNICINNNDELELRYIGGKNLLCLGTVTGGLGLTINKANNSAILINGMPTGYGMITIPLINSELLKSAHYTLSLRKHSGTVSTDFQISFPESNNFKNITINSDVKVVSTGGESGNELTYLTITVPNGIVFTNLVLDLQLEQDYNATPFESYKSLQVIDEEYLKDINVNFGEKFGSVNTIVLSRSADADKIARSIPSDLADENKNAITIKDNQIMNDDNREQYLKEILNKLYDLEFYLNDFTSTGITYLESCDKYKISANGNNYTCVMFNDEVNITQGLVEQIDTPMPEKSETDYKYVTPTDKIERVTSLIVDKVNSKITAQAKEINIIATHIDKTNGDIKEVTPINTEEKYFTFNSEGLTIESNQTNYKRVADETGDYYYDGSTPTGEYTKSGSKQKDLTLFGVYKYGMDDYNDTPMFVAQLYTDEDGNEGFGHFLNKDVQ